MQNYVPMDNHGSFYRTLFVGLAMWPNGWQEDYQRDQIVFAPEYGLKGPSGQPVAVELPLEIAVWEHQTAGHACHHIQLFGVFFKVNANSHVLSLEDKYFESQIGWGVNPYSCLRELEADLSNLGLGMANNGYQHFEEGFIPIDARDALEYARSHAGNLLLPPDGKPVVWDALWPDIDAMEKYLRDAWKAAKVWRPWPTTERDRALTEFRGCMSEHVIGAFVFGNCD